MAVYECYTTRGHLCVTVSGEPGDGESPDAEDLFEVRIIDNDHNTYQQVMDVTMLALGLDPEQAFAAAWTVDHRGSCVVAIAPQRQAEHIASVIRTIGIEVQVNPVSGRDC